MTPEFWKSRGVFVTGHTGFKGSWLSLWLAALGARTTGFALPAATTPNLYDLAGVSKDLTSISGDIRDAAKVASAIRSASPEIIFHLAAQSLVRPSYADPLETFATNVMGTAHVLEAARHCPSVRAVIVVTSDKCYENREWAWPYRETEAMGGHDPYSASKGCAELVTASYRRSFFASRERPVAVASARAGNVIGGGDWAADRLVPDIMRAISSGTAVRIRNPGAERPWQHVLDPLCGYLTLAERLFGGSGDFADGWNFGPWDEDTRNVGWVTDAIVRSWGGDAKWTRDTVQAVHEANILKLDSSKARAMLGWRPRLRIEDTIDWTVAWYRQWAAGADMRAATLAQIKQYGERSA